jgi:2-polyprenyl-6-methoxyphenol hydroxylase-like FAD-dependent oxidoreductase
MAGLFFARAGLGALVLGKHGDFLQDFRGDTVHAPTPRLFHELGLLKNDRVSGVDVYVGD